MTDEVRIQQYRCVIDDLKEQIERMKRSGRRRREEARRLKKTLIEEQARSRIAIMTALSKK